MIEQQQTLNEATVGQSALTDLLGCIAVGDMVTIEVCGDNGKYVGQYGVIDADDHSIAVTGGHGPWWFYRDTGHAYVGNAKILCV
jgi:uncharacterized Ntn-hydrolase superfamily protein